MHASLATPLLLAAGALASPLSLIQRRGPETCTSKAFTLVANITSPSTLANSLSLFNRSVQSWTLTGIHVGAGLDTAVLNSADNITFVQNGTTASSASPSLTAPVSTYPYGLTVSKLVSGENDAGLGASENEVYIGVNVGLGTPGVSIASTPYAQAAINATASLPSGVAGSFVVCNETEVVYGRPQYPVRFVAVAEGGSLVVPTECVAITLLAQCEALPELPSGALYSYQGVQEVPCYDNVKGIDWTKY